MKYPSKNAEILIRKFLLHVIFLEAQETSNDAAKTS